MRLARRILITVICTVAAIIVAVRLIAPIALSFYAARRVPAIARVVPTELQDRSISQIPGMRLSYVGYEFEIPWDDLDESKTQLYPKDKPAKTRAVLNFRSGLRVMVTAIPPREMADECTKGDFKMPPQALPAVFGRGAEASDYTFVNNVYEFTPDKMHYWSLSDRLHAREMVLLTIKSIMPTASAETGIFRVQNQAFKGFQQGNPVKHPHGVVLTLYSEDGGVEFIFSEQDYRNPLGVTQPEMNRIIETLHRSAPSLTATAAK
jgi:hypothetical protein